MAYSTDKTTPNYKRTHRSTTCERCQDETSNTWPPPDSSPVPDSDSGVKQPIRRCTSQSALGGLWGLVIWVTNKKDSGLQWTSTSFIKPEVKEQFFVFEMMSFNQVMIHEKFLYDRKTGEWTREKYLQDLQDRLVIKTLPKPQRTRGLSSYL